MGVTAGPGLKALKGLRVRADEILKRELPSNFQVFHFLDA
jgi:hypothetical protein